MPSHRSLTKVRSAPPTSPRFLRGGRSPIPVVQVRLYRADSTVDVTSMNRGSMSPISITEAVPRGLDHYRWIWVVGAIALLLIVASILLHG